MSFFSRVKQVFGGVGGAYKTLASAATLAVGDEDTVVYVSGTATVTALSASARTRGRVVTFIGSSGAAVVFTNTNDTTTANLMDLGGADITLGANDVLMLLLSSTGAWLRVTSTNN